MTVTTPKLHKAQSEIEHGSRRFNVLCCGRRFGKDIYLERKATRMLLKSKQPVGWFAPTYRMLLENWRMMRKVLTPVILRVSESEHRIDLITGNPLEMWSLDNQDSGVGRKYGHVIINEAALVSDLSRAWNMIIRPTLADYRGSADIASTPRGLNGFYELWKQAGEGGDWARFHYRTEDNPYIPRDEIAAMRATMPARVVKQEIDAEFVEDGAFFQGVDAACTITAHDTPEQHKGHYICAGLDWALSEDFTALTIACRDCNKVIYWDRFNRMDYTYQREIIKDACKKYNVAALLPERNSIGQPNIEMLMQMRLSIATGPDGGAGFNTSATTKPQLILKLANALEHDGLKVPVEYADELRSYQVEVSATNPKFGAPEGQHDDRVISLALCWWAMTMYSRYGGIHV